jgi:multidrug efflux pump subunit AcrA (membrane-fusion protein)
MFGRVRVPASSPYEAMLVPDTAIGSEQVRKYILVVDNKDTVRQKYVTLGQLVGNLRVIKTGIAPTDRVVVEGLARVHVGQKVKTETKQAVPNKPMAKAGLPSGNTD